VHVPAQCVHYLRLITGFIDPGKGRHSPAFAFTHTVSVPNPRHPRQDPIYCQLRQANCAFTVNQEWGAIEPMVGVSSSYKHAFCPRQLARLPCSYRKTPREKSR
jgi:hypothetical protein